MRQNWKTTAVTAAGLIAVILIILFLHHLSQEQVFSQFQEDQFLHAQDLSDHIESFCLGHYSTLRAIQLSCRREGMKRLREDVELYAALAKGNVYIKTISLYDESGKTIWSTDNKLIALKDAEREFFVWAKKGENKGEVFASMLAPGASPSPQDLDVLLAVPLYQESSDKNDSVLKERFIGVLSFVTDLRGFLLREIKAELFEQKVWIMRRDGTLLFYPSHPEMVFRSIFQKDKTCVDCHTSFGYVEKILREENGKTEYEVKGERKKVASFAPVRFGNLFWILAVTSDRSEVTAFLNRSLMGHIALFGAIVLIFVSGSVLLIHRERMKIRAEEEAKRWQKAVAEEKEVEEELRGTASRLRFFSSELLMAQEAERRRISRELHDELGGTLGALKFKFNFVGRSLHEDQMNLQMECKECLEHIDRVIDNIHRICKDLSPAILENLGLASAIRYLVDNFTKTYGIKVDVDADEMDSSFSKEAQLIIYRIFQEALGNVGKHAQAQNVAIHAERENGTISFHIEDDGKGFDVRKALMKNSHEGGLGLRIMEERVEMLRGTFELRSGEGKGTDIAFSIPIMEYSL